MNPFKVGDEVEFIPTAKAHSGYRTDMTVGKRYVVVKLWSDKITVLDDVCDKHDIPHMHFKLYTGSQAAALANPVGQHAQICHPIPVCDFETDSEDDYDTRKANRRVTSEGKFNKGDVLVYCDGTPINTTRTVTRCTATCVWFEETYSQPFSPDEFRVEKCYE